MIASSMYISLWEKNRKTMKENGKNEKNKQTFAIAH